MAYETLLTETREGVATITLNRPEALNAITRNLLLELRDALTVADKDDSVRVIVLTGRGRAFSAGVDLKDLGDRELVNGGVGDYLDEPARAVIQTIRKIRKVVIARINGHCYTGALELALACDLIVCANEANLGDTHAKWGLRPSWGMSARLPAAVGRMRAQELSYTARTFTGEEAAAWGLANRSVPLADLDASVAELAAAIRANSAGSIAAYKALYTKGGSRTERKALQFEEEKDFEIDDTNERLAEFRK